MATKLKNSKVFISLVSFLFLFLLAIGICFSYPKIDEISKLRGYNYFEMYEFYEILNKESYELYLQQLVKSKENQTLLPEDIFLLETVEDRLEIFQALKNGYYEEDDYYQCERDDNNENSTITNTETLSSQQSVCALLDSFDEEIESIPDQVFNRLSKEEQLILIEPMLNRSLENLESSLIDYQIENLSYFVINHETGEKIGDESLQQLLTAGASNELNDLYQYYVVLNYDVNGNLEVEQLFGAEFKQKSKYEPAVIDAKQEVKNYFIDPYFLRQYVNIDVKPIKDTTFVYAVPKTLIYYDEISRQQETYSYWGVQEALMPISFVTGFIIFIFSCLIPIQTVRKNKLIHHFLSWPIETLLLTATLPVAIFVELLPSLVHDTIHSEFNYFLSAYFSHEMMNRVVFILNLIIWFVVLAWIFILSLYVRNLLKQGWKLSLKENCWTYRIYRFILKKLNAFLVFDLKEKNKKRLFMIVFGQFILLSLFCLGWFFGIFGVFIYSIILYFILRKKMIEIEENYARLFKVTKQLADGNLDVEMNENLGIFNAFKEEVRQVQDGLKKAVDAEVKSQRMKTELIANVSHDLKTPLTSIITYTDLLKDKNLSDEKRAQYLETLDQKAHRLKVLIEDLFEMSKANSGNITMNLQEVDITSLMKQTLLELEDKIKEANLMIRSNFPDHKVTLMLDSDRMFRVFDNLILNMTKYAMPSTRAYLEIVENDNQVQIIFKNISAEEINVNVNELMERFVRGDQARHTEGSGLGLAIAKSFVELQGGTLQIQVDGDLFKVMLTFNK